MITYRISIPEPCNENWDQMTPKKNGRHCASCNKVVKDFTGMTDQEIVEYLLKNTSVCGRLNSIQLNKSILYFKPVKYTKYHWPSVATFIIAGMFVISPSIAQTIPQKLYDNNLAIPKYPIVKANVDSILTIQNDSTIADSINKINTTRTVKGKVIEKGTLDPIPFCAIVIELNGRMIIGQYTDENGKFKIELPDDCKEDSIQLAAHVPGAEKTVIGVNMDPVLIQNEITVEVTYSKAFAGAIIIKSETIMDTPSINSNEPIGSTRYNHKRIMNYPGQ
jgi:hypothetical protein